MLRLQRGTDDGADQGLVYFCEGALIHALAGEAVGDEAMCELLGWSDGRFRLVRDADQQPRTITRGLANFITAAESSRSTGGLSAAPGKEESGDEQLLHDLLTRPVAARAGQGAPARNGQVEPGAVPALLLIATVVNSMVAVVTARCSDSDVLPSRVLPRLAETQPYTQLLGEDQERISIATAVGVLKTLEQHQGRPAAAVPGAVPGAARRAGVLRQHGRARSSTAARARGMARHVRRVRRGVVDGRAAVEAAE